MAESLSDDAMIDLLSTEEDRLSRAAVDDLLRRPRLAPRLAALIDEEELWESADWAPIHATFLLAAMKGPGALEAVLRALERAADHEEAILMDVADSLLATFGPESVPALVAAFEHAGSYPRIWIDDALAQIADAHPGTRDAVRAHLRNAALKTRETEVAACAAGNLLALATPEDREVLSILEDRNLIDAEAIEEALSGNADRALPRPVDWLRFYDADAIAARNERAEEPDEEAELDPDSIVPSDPALDVLSRLDEPGAGPAPLVNAAPKVGRNDPCPCGSGRKFKKCCAT